ncbi:MAG: hypothetical protein Q9160_004519 [Pyrenula sp. 1 TL-2023]
MPDNEDLHARIGVLAGRINRHKHQKTSEFHGVPYPSVRSHLQPPRRPPTRARPSFRNHSLVTHGRSNNTASDEVDQIDNAALQEHPNGLTKTEGRTMKWYRPEVLEKQNMARAEEKKMKAKEFQDQERAKVKQFAESKLRPNTQMIDSPPLHTITIEGIPFAFNRTYNKLLRPSGSTVPTSATPKQFAGWAEEKDGALQTLHIDWYQISPTPLTGTLDLTTLFRSKVSVQREIDALASTMATKPRFARASSEMVNALPAIAVTSPTSCRLRKRPHVAITCGEDAPTNHAGILTRRSKQCSLPHVDHAGQMRQVRANQAGNPVISGVDADDVSSDEETIDEIDSDDADSDDVFEPEAVFGTDSGSEIARQDFIKLT